MNGAHLHLLVNHVSLFFLVIGVVALAASMKRKSVDLRVLAAALFVGAGVFGWITVESGEKAADILHALDATTDPFVDQHAAAAAWAQRSGFLIAALALGMEWAARWKKNWFRIFQWALLIFAIHGCTVFMRTAYLGGLIRHIEIRN